MKEKRKHIFLIVLFIVFITILMLNLLTPMVADDYMYSYSFDTKDRIQSVFEIFPSLVKHAQVLNGRIIPDFFVHLFLLLPRPIFSILNSIIFIVFILGMYRLIKASQSKYDWQLLSILAGAVFLLPIVFGQTNLWLTGSINYLWRDTLLVWVFVPFSDIIIRKKNFSGSWKWFFIAVASLYIGNSTENASTSAILFMVLCILWQILQNRRICAWMLIATGFTILGWLLLVLSPGTSRDMSNSSASLNQIAQHFGVALDMWRKHGLWLSIAYLIVFFFSKKNPNVSTDQLAFSAGLFICSIVSNFIMAAAYYYPDRAFINTTNLLIIAITMALYSSSSSYRDTIVNILASVLVLTMVLEMTSAVPNAYNRFRQAQARVNEVCIARDSGFRDITTYGIKGLSKYDAFFGLNELTDNPDYAPNIFFSKYYSLGSVVVDRYE